MKPCRKCGVMFEATQRQINKSDFICHPCDLLAKKEWRAKRKASGNPVVSTKMPKEWHKEYQLEYKKKPEVKKRKAEQMRAYRNDPLQRHKHIARWLVNRAVKTKRLIKQPCEDCGAKKVDAHHEDYFKPLDVRWLCRQCHLSHHTKAKGKE